MKSCEPGWKLDEPNCRPRGEGKGVTWASLTMFRVRDRKIAEEWVCRDELGMLIQLGAVATFQIIWNVGFGSGVDISLILIDVR
jgi:hypothetical protein